MLRGKVIGSVVSTVKDEELRGIKLLVVQTVGDSSAGDILIAADAIRISGIGDYVYLIHGKEGALAISDRRVPIDCSIVGVIDSYEEAQLKKGVR